MVSGQWSPMTVGFNGEDARKSGQRREPNPIPVGTARARRT